MSEQDKFLMELTELTKKYGLIVEGCGCCGSPFIEEVEGDGHYLLPTEEPAYERRDVKWVTEVNEEGEWF